MASVGIKKWVWLPLLVMLIGLLVVLNILILQGHSKKQGSSQAPMSAQAAEIAKQDGKTENLTLVTPQSSSVYNVEIASADASRVKGLSGRDGLADHTGMLFIFPEAGFDCFWMKDMKFDIDMLWFDDNQNLVHVQENASKSTYPSSFCPQTPAQYVLEVPAGSVKQLGLQIGDRFTRP